MYATDVNPNAVYLAERGHSVTAVDRSAVGLADAGRLPEELLLRRFGRWVRRLRRLACGRDGSPYPISPGFPKWRSRLIRASGRACC